MTYADKLKDPRWQRKRLEIFERDSFACENCQSRDKTLHVHHKYYLKGVDVWDYEDDAYQTLCHDCHSEITEQNQLIAKILGKELYTSAMKDTFLTMLENVKFANFLFLLYEHYDWVDRLCEAFNAKYDFLVQDELQNEIIEPEY